MTAQLDRRSALTLPEILEAVKSLTPADQARLRDELASLAQVTITAPDVTQEAKQRGQELADQLRRELRSAPLGELDQVMSLLRGRMWSS